MSGSRCGSLGEGREGKPQRVGPREAAGSATCRPRRRAKRVAPRGRGQEGVAGPCAQRREVRGSHGVTLILLWDKAAWGEHEAPSWQEEGVPGAVTPGTGCPEEEGRRRAGVLAATGLCAGLGG